jgi:hypothetical protein
VFSSKAAHGFIATDMAIAAQSIALSNSLCNHCITARSGGCTHEIQISHTLICWDMFSSNDWVEQLKCDAIHQHL